MRQDIQSIEETLDGNSKPGQIAQNIFNTVVFGVDNALNKMSTSILKQVEHAGFVVHKDLENQGKNNARLWLLDKQWWDAVYTKHMMFYEEREMLHVDNFVNLWTRFEEERTGHHLSWCNQALLQGLRDASSAHFMFTDEKQYLGTIIIADGGHAVVRKKIKGSKPQAVEVTWKKPGSGADSVWNFHGQEVQAYARHIILTGVASLRRRLSTEINAQPNRQVFLENLWWVLLPKSSNGKTEENKTDIKETAYKVFAITEFQKQDGNGVKKLAPEQSCSHSGQGDGSEQVNWATSVNCQTMTTNQTAWDANHYADCNSTTTYTKRKCPLSYGIK